MSIACDVAAPFVATSAVEGGPVLRPLRAHTESCLKCQARHAAMSKTARALAGMASEKSVAPADLEWRVMSSLEGNLAIGPTQRRPAALVAAVLSMIAAIVIWRLRPRAAS